MILQPFTVNSQGTQYRFVEQAALDNEAQKLLVDEAITDNLDAMQHEAQCAQIGLKEFGPVPNMRFAVFDNSTFTGVWMLGALGYVSGPWADTVDWQVTDPNAPAIWTARPMPGFLGMQVLDELKLAVDTATKLLGRGAPFRSVQGTNVEFKSLHWAIYKNHTDRRAVRANALHLAAQSDVRLRVTETADPDDAHRTLAKLELV